jgi:hypothetical protein
MMATRSMDEEKRQQFDILLVQPPPGSAATPTDMEAMDEGAAFLAFQAQVSGGLS